MSHSEAHLFVVGLGPPAAAPWPSAQDPLPSWNEGPAKQAIIHDETGDIGNDTGAPVTGDYKMRAFSGEVSWVEIDVDKAGQDADHLISPKERLAIAMAIQ